MISDMYSMYTICTSCYRYRVYVPVHSLAAHINFAFRSQTHKALFHSIYVILTQSTSIMQNG